MLPSRSSLEQVGAFGAPMVGKFQFSKKASAYQGSCHHIESHLGYLLVCHPNCERWRCRASDDYSNLAELWQATEPHRCVRGYHNRRNDFLLPFLVDAGTFPLYAPQHSQVPLHRQVNCGPNMLPSNAHLGFPVYWWHRRRPFGFVCES